MRYFEKLFHTVVISMFIGLMSSLAFAADPVKVGFVYVGPLVITVGPIVMILVVNK